MACTFEWRYLISSFEPEMKILTLPGLIDIHVHLRDPGETYKEDFLTGTRAALAGGMTTVFDMPNNIRPVFSKDALDEKICIAEKKAVCDWGLYFGTDGKNISEFEKVIGDVVGLKIYLTETTGKYFIEDPSLLRAIFSAWPESKPIVIHAEGEKIDLALSLGSQYKKRIHITHIANQEMLEKILEFRKKGQSVTCDVTPHHLFLNTENSSMKSVKPHLGSLKDNEFFWQHLGDIECIASDHAPHTKKEKAQRDPPSGFPGLETMLPLLLTAVREKRMTIEDIIRMTHTNPMKLFGMNQSDDTYTEIDTEQEYSIGSSGYYSKSAWSPFEGKKGIGVVKKVFLRGRLVFSEGKILALPGCGKTVSSLPVG